MRINKKWLKQHRHAKQLKIPKVVRGNFSKEIVNDDVPSQQQIKMAINLGIVKKDFNGNLDVKSLANYFKTFIQQRQADDQRH